MKWFFCLNEGEWQFEMAQVAVHTAKIHTNFEPVCIYDGRQKKILDWMASQNVQVIQYRSPLYPHICKTYEIDMDGPRSYKATGAWARMHIPILTDEDFIFYTDTDVMFLGGCKDIENIKPEWLAVVNDFNPLNSYAINSGVMIMNCKNLRIEYEEFLKYTKENMHKSWTTYDQVAYENYYAHRSFRMPLEYNWKSFWEKDYAVWYPNIRIERCIPVQILHFTGTKPWDTTRYKEGLGIYRGPNNYIWHEIWVDYYNQVKLVPEESIPMTKNNVLSPYYTFFNMPEPNNTKMLEDLILDFGINTVDYPSDYPDFIHNFQPKIQMRIWQQPNQLASFLSWIYDHKEEINNYTEIGIAFGGTFYVIDSYLRAVNPKFEYSTGVDRFIRINDWITYKMKFCQTKFVESDSLQYMPEKNIDLCLIDTDHNYLQVKAEYEKYKPKCKFMAFHDISSITFPEMKIFWEEMKANHEYWEFTQQYQEREVMGIGVIRV